MENIVVLMVSQLLSGLTRAMILFVVASGLSLIFGVLSVLNFAHGSFYMIGAFIFYWLWLRFPQSGASFWLSLLLAPVIIGLIGLGIELLLIRRTYKRGHIPQLLLTYGLTLIASDIVRMGWGGKLFTIPAPRGLNGTIQLWNISFPTYNVFLILVGLGIYVSLWLLIYKTKLGKIIRAAVYDREVVSFLGVRIPFLFSAVFVLGVFLAGLAGGLFLPLSTVDMGMDASMLIECFAVVIIGGVGSITGTLLGALIVSEIYAFGILLFPQVALGFIFFVLIIILIFRPYGLLGRPL